VDQDTGGRSFDSRDEAVGSVEVTEVKEKIAYCKPLSAARRSRRA